MKAIKCNKILQAKTFLFNVSASDRNTTVLSFCADMFFWGMCERQDHKEMHSLNTEVPVLWNESSSWITFNLSGKITFFKVRQMTFFMNLNKEVHNLTITTVRYLWFVVNFVDFCCFCWIFLLRSVGQNNFKTFLAETWSFSCTN